VQSIKSESFEDDLAARLAGFQQGMRALSSVTELAFVRPQMSSLAMPAFAVPRPAE